MIELTKFWLVSCTLIVVHLKCVCAFNSRGPFRIFRGRSPPPFPPLSISLPRLTAAQNFNSNYEMPPFMRSPPTPPSTNYGVPDIGYGPLTSTVKPIVYKHIYVHVPPPEPEIESSRAPLKASPPQKHYKIVFIKAPPPPTPTVPEIPVQPLDEEKTLVYVLVKKPDDPPNIVMPTPPTTQPSKPEVYFIRYKTQKEQPSSPYSASVTLGPPLAAYGTPNGPTQRRRIILDDTREYS